MAKRRVSDAPEVNDAKRVAVENPNSPYSDNDIGGESLGEIEAAADRNQSENVYESTHSPDSWTDPNTATTKTSQQQSSYPSVISSHKLAKGRKDKKKSGNQQQSSSSSAAPLSEPGISIDEANSVHLRISVTQKEAVALIGRGGSTILKIRQKANVRMNVSDNYPGAQERILNIRGTPDFVGKAAGLIVRILHDEPLDTDSTPESRPYSFRLLVPHPLMGALIGRKGERFREIITASAAKLEAQERLLPNSDDRFLIVFGVADAIHIAIFYISQTILQQKENPNLVHCIHYNPARTGGGPGQIATNDIIPFNRYRRDNRNDNGGNGRNYGIENGGGQYFDPFLRPQPHQGQRSMISPSLVMSPPYGRPSHHLDGYEQGYGGPPPSLHHIPPQLVYDNPYGRPPPGGQYPLERGPPPPFNSSSNNPRPYPGSGPEGGGPYRGNGRPPVRSFEPRPSAPLVSGNAALYNAQVEAQRAPPNEEIKQQVYVPEDVVGVVIGKNGTQIKDIRRVSGSFIKVTDPSPGKADRLVLINGLPENNQLAIYLIHQRIENDKKLKMK